MAWARLRAGTPDGFEDSRINAPARQRAYPKFDRNPRYAAWEPPHAIRPPTRDLLAYPTLDAPMPLLGPIASISPNPYDLKGFRSHGTGLGEVHLDPQDLNDLRYFIIKLS